MDKPELILPQSTVDALIEKEKKTIKQYVWYFMSNVFNKETDELKSKEVQINSINQLIPHIDGRDCFGIIYLIENLDNGRKYIGKKQIMSNRRTKLGKRALAARTDKRASKFKKTAKESNWLSYTGSNKELNLDIKNGQRYKKHILALAYTKAELSYLETKYQFIFDVLETPEYYNGNILGKFYNQYKPTK